MRGDGGAGMARDWDGEEDDGWGDDSRGGFDTNTASNGSDKKQGNGNSTSGNGTKKEVDEFF